MNLIERLGQCPLVKSTRGEPGFKSKIVNDKWPCGTPVRLSFQGRQGYQAGFQRSCVVVKMYSPLRHRFALDFGKQTAVGVGCSGRIARLMRWNETRTYWLGLGVWFVAAWPFQAEDFSPLAWGIPNWSVKPCPFSYSGNSPLKEIA